MRRARAVIDDPYNAFITQVEPGEAGPGPLSGRTLAVKDLFDTAGHSHDVRLRSLRRPRPRAQRDVAVQRLLDAGAVIVGKTHLPEFAWGVLGQSEWYGTCHNPAHPGKTTGGSSSGSAAALAAGLCELALGSDTGCSIRLPSAACEVVGLKSQWGLISTEGVFPLVPTLDTVGPMARSVEDVALMWSVLTGRPVPEPGLGWPHGRPPAAAAGHRRRPRDERSDAAEAWVGRSRAARRSCRRGARPEPSREHVAAVPARGAAVARRDLPEPRRRVRRADAEEAARRAASEPRRRSRPRTARSTSGAATSPRSISTSARATRRATRTRRRTSSRCGCRSRRSCAGRT